MKKQADKSDQRTLLSFKGLSGFRVRATDGRMGRGRKTKIMSSYKHTLRRKQAAGIHFGLLEELLMLFWTLWFLSFLLIMKQQQLSELQPFCYCVCVVSVLIGLISFTAESEKLWVNEELLIVASAVSSCVWWPRTSSALIIPQRMQTSHRGSSHHSLNKVHFSHHKPLPEAFHELPLTAARHHFWSRFFCFCFSAHTSWEVLL